jgi:hypothetical protein
MTNKLRQKLDKGSLVTLDKGYANSSNVEVVSQTPGKLYTEVRVPGNKESWSVMTDRLTIKSLEE